MDKHFAWPKLKPNPALQVLDILVGEWNVNATHPSFPAGVSGRAAFEWFEGGALLVMRAAFEQPGPPSGVSVIGRDDGATGYRVLYYDERGVSRIYEMSLEGRTWRMGRDAPGFGQRFRGEISPDGGTITALWQKSSDGKTWEDDLALTYARAR